MPAAPTASPSSDPTASAATARRLRGPVRENTARVSSRTIIGHTPGAVSRRTEDCPHPPVKEICIFLRAHSDILNSMKNVTLKQLRLVRAAHEKGSFAAAAEASHVTPPAVIPGRSRRRRRRGRGSSGRAPGSETALGPLPSLRSPGTTAVSGPSPGPRRPPPFPHIARRRRSTICMISGVRISCMAMSSLPPGMTIEFARLMKLSWIIDRR